MTDDNTRQPDEPMSDPRPAPAAAPTPEEELWSGGPSQWVNAHWYALCVVLIPILLIVASFYFGVWWLFLLSVIPLAFAGYRYLKTATTRYTLTTERLKWRWGILARHTEEVELYRVRDLGYTQPLHQRVLGLGTIEVTSTDERTPHIVLGAIRDADRVREYFRESTERMRQLRGVRDIDMS
ncbi:MAG TPA: PH domain-containing protein [Phycisphaerales bacterium]|nr:PH domain-containing protein [Phycisphaerales bacterium]